MEEYDNFKKFYFWGHEYALKIPILKKLSYQQINVISDSNQFLQAIFQRK